MVHSLKGGFDTLEAITRALGAYKQLCRRGFSRIHISPSPDGE
jgi:hypothetical protein